MRIFLPLILALVVPVGGCQPHQWVANVNGFDRFDGVMPEATSVGDEPELVAANLVTGRPAYFEFQVVGPSPVTHIFVQADDEVFVADVDDLPVVGICEWLAKANSGDQTSALLGLASDCTAACEEACSCFQTCSELPTDLGIIGSPAALCTASCSQSGGSIEEFEFADTFGEIYGCNPQSCDTRPQWVGMVEVTYPEIKSEAIMAQPVSAPDNRGSLSAGDIEGATMSTGQRQGCIQY